MKIDKEKIIDGVKQAEAKSNELASKTKDKVVKAVDQNGNGEIDIEDVIILGLKTPGIKIDRDKFLRKELENHFSAEVVEDAIAYNPMHAGIDSEFIDNVANEIIKYERICVSGISAALGAPGGIAMVATIPADIGQYYGYLLRATQKLMYLYGFPAINLEENEQIFDTATINVLIICLGVMYGTVGANNALKAMAKGLANGVEKALMKKALTKGTIYPIVKSVAKMFGQKMTKEVFAGFFKKAIPVVGGVVGGGITYLSFKPCCDKLKENLQDTMLSNKNHIETEEEKSIIFEDVDFSVEE